MAYPPLKHELDPDLYNIQPQESAFFKQLTNIHDDELLKQHIIQVQSKAYEIYSYQCIYRFTFTRFKIPTLSGYKQAFSLLKERNRAILIDIGCCLGTEVRKAVFDGWPIQDIIASDIQKDFWEYGHQLFKSTPETFPVAFIPGDVFDPAFISQRGKISAIHMSTFFHLFSEDRQLQLAKFVSSLLSPKKGSVIFGQHVGMPVKGLRDEVMYNGLNMFCHSPENWMQMWIEDVFGGEDKDGNDRVNVETELISAVRKSMADYSKDENVWLLKWSVTRL